MTEKEMTRVRDRDVRYQPIKNEGVLRVSATRP